MQILSERTENMNIIFPPETKIRALAFILNFGISEWSIYRSIMNPLIPNIVVEAVISPTRNQYKQPYGRSMLMIYDILCDISIPNKIKYLINKHLSVFE